MNAVFRSSALALLFAAAFAPAVFAGAGPPPDPEQPGLSATRRLQVLIERVKHEQKKLETLEADFVQEKSSEFLAAPESSTGTFAYARPDKVRWEYSAPKPISLVIDGDQMTTWYRDLGRAERVKVGRVSSQVFQYLNASGSLESLLDYFSVTYSPPPPGSAYELLLQPRYSRIAKRLSSMTLWIDRALYLPVRVRYVEPSGDTTEYRLEKLRPNGGIPDARFRLVLPPEVEVREIDLGGGRSRAGKP
jgi:outer membrane lipoprotein carrier protein